MYSDAVIGARIATIFDDELGLYGAKRIAASLNEDTAYVPVNHKKVARIMKAMGLKGFTKRRRCVTTRRKPGHRVMPDLVGRKFTANEPNRVYVGDITYLPCKGGKNMYLATVIDTSFTQTCRLCARRQHASVTGRRCNSPRARCTRQS